MATPAVRSASAATPTDLAPHLPRSLPSRFDQQLRLTLVPASALSRQTKETLYALFHANMGPLSAGTSMAYKRRAKMDEMFHPDTRFFVVTSGQHVPGAMPRKPVADVEGDEVLGFASFRFDTEETMSNDDVEVVYCYELQLSPRARGSGLGTVLMSEMEAVGQRTGMAKVMLTCLANNTAALAFYAKAGYAPDEIDPTRVAEEDGWEDVDEDGEPRRPDYRILSKEL